MKIWVTRSTAFSIQCGGLERLQVWFRKPEYIETWNLSGMPPDMPFDDPTEKAGIRTSSGWQVRESGNMWITESYSFGKMFGYCDRGNSEDEISEYVWNKLNEHFGNTPFNEWHEYERKHEECCVRRFLIELEIEVNIKGA